MIQVQTKIKVADNSGAKYARCIKTLKGFNRQYAYTGDLVIVSIRELRRAHKLKIGELYLGLVVRTVKSSKYIDGSRTSFKTNSIVLLTKTKKLIGTRIFGPVSKNLRRKKLMKLIMMSSYSIV